MSEGAELAKGWVQCDLGGLIRIIRGVSYKKGQASTRAATGLVPILRANNIQGQLMFEDLVYVPRDCVSDDQLLRPGDIVLAASSGSRSVVGKAAQFARPWTGSFGAFCMGLRPVDDIEKRFIGYFLQTDEYRHRVSRLSAGVNINNLRREHIESVPVRLAPYGEQRRIVAKIEELFSDLDAGVAALERVRANLKRYRASVLKAAAEGRLTARWRAQNPTTEPASKLLGRILAERRRNWEAAQVARFSAAGKAPPKNWRDKYDEPSPPGTTGLPELPKGWCWATVGQLVARSEYGTSVKCTHEAAHSPVLRIPNIAGGAIDLGNLKMSTQPLNLDEDSALRKGDMLMCRTNGSISLIGKVALLKTDLHPWHTFASYLLRFRFVETSVLPAWVCLYSQSIHGRRFIETHTASSAGQHNISLSLIHRMALPLPPLDEQIEAVALCEERISAAATAEALAEANSRRSVRLRESILKRAFEGRLVVQDPADEPATLLLERITRLLGEGVKAAPDTRTRPCGPPKRARSRKIASSGP